ncbi:hypothetical protein ARMSODRAFT_981872 [Armillaria solidipes]|uniref:Uncharacterized protein n=1 Tax=Armillaria solidipes TaxID=1076256 RepID=A0A2H3B1M9_9AGAR|nr:hypothetical protein ARMSODRAFT_981872 [Armillaria solidipes]
MANNTPFEESARRRFNSTGKTVGSGGYVQGLQIAIGPRGDSVHKDPGCFLGARGALEKGNMRGLTDKRGQRKRSSTPWPREKKLKRPCSQPTVEAVGWPSENSWNSSGTSPGVELSSSGNRRCSSREWKKTIADRTLVSQVITRSGVQANFRWVSKSPSYTFHPENVVNFFDESLNLPVTGTSVHRFLCAKFGPLFPDLE